MGKTGTSAIQKTLTEKTVTLEEQGIKYLGMWFDLVDENFHGRFGLRQLFAKSDQEKRVYARQFFDQIKRMNEENDCSTFILSNETLFLHGIKLQPFVTELAKKIEIQIVIFLRDVYSWLPSAYTQWCIRHKGTHGEPQGYYEEGSRLVQWYENFDFWNDNYPDQLVVRKMGDGNDVVTTFFEALGISMQVDSNSGFYQRENPSITLLRSIFNSTFYDPIRPEIFGDTLFNGEKIQNKGLDHYIDQCFNFDHTKDIVRENQPIFDLIKKSAGIDLLSSSGSTISKPDVGKLRDDLLYYLTVITVHQAKEIEKLKNDIEIKDIY